MSKDARRPIQNITQNLGRLGNAKIGPEDLPYLYQLMGNIADLIQKVEGKYGKRKHAKPDRRANSVDTQRAEIPKPDEL